MNMPKEQKPSTRGTYTREPYPSGLMASQLPVLGPQSHTSPTNERSSTAWTREDDLQLMKARSESQNWGPIATKYFPSKTPNACRKRHERLMEKRQGENWDGVKLDSLAKAYLDCREEMWQILAEKVGEKWSLVESKCMEKGLKTLQQAARSASRRNRNPSSSPADHRSDDDHFDDNNFDDSGLGLDGTPGNDNSHMDYPPPTSGNSRASSGPAYTSPSGHRTSYSIASHSSNGLSSSGRLMRAPYGEYTQVQMQADSQAPSPVDSRRTSQSLPSFKAFENITFSTPSVSMPSMAYCS